MMTQLSSEPMRMSDAAIDLFWLPLGAGGYFVRLNGRVYEFLKARQEHRAACDLYHTALQVSVPEGRYIIENSWPIPDNHLDARGVTIQGPVWTAFLGRFRIFRYEIRRWLNGTIADMAEAVASPQRVSEDQDQARRLLALTENVPAHVWGRDHSDVGDMWNSNSVISWLLANAGIDAGTITPPVGGRAPGWKAGVRAALQDASFPRAGMPENRVA
jgi:hypothetical protein